MSDTRQYEVRPHPRSMSKSRTLESWKSFHFQNLSLPPFTMGADNWLLIFKLGHSILTWSGQIFDICSSCCVTWLWSWHKRPLWRVNRQSSTGLIYYRWNQFKVISLECTLRTRNLFNFCDIRRGLTTRQITLTSLSRRQPVTIDYCVTWH